MTGGRYALDAIAPNKLYPPVWFNFKPFGSDRVQYVLLISGIRFLGVEGSSLQRRSKAWLTS